MQSIIFLSCTCCSFTCIVSELKFYCFCRAEKGGKREQNLLIKQMEKNKREAEKQKKRFELELQKEKLQSVSYPFQLFFFRAPGI